MNKKQMVETLLNNKGYDVLDIEEFLKEHYENLNSVEKNVVKFEKIFVKDEFFGILNYLDIQMLRDEFESLIRDDEGFKENWAYENGDYRESDFYEWLQDVINTSTFEDIIEYCKVV